MEMVNAVTIPESAAESREVVALGPRERRRVLKWG
jgi:hypothetical protein